MEKVWARFRTGKGSSETVGEGFWSSEWPVVASTSAPDVRWVCCSVLHVSEGIPLIRVLHVHTCWRDIPLSFTACESIRAQCRWLYCAFKVLTYTDSCPAGWQIRSLSHGNTDFGDITPLLTDMVDKLQKSSPASSMNRVFWDCVAGSATFSPSGSQGNTVSCLFAGLFVFSLPPPKGKL